MQEYHGRSGSLLSSVRFFRMRRRLRLRVLYWPTLSSAAMTVVLVWGSGAFEQPFEQFTNRLGIEWLTDGARTGRPGAAEEAAAAPIGSDLSIPLPQSGASTLPLRTLASELAEGELLRAAGGSVAPREQEVPSRRGE